MPPADAQGVSVPLSLFSGLDTEINPADLPEGVSPDCQDVIFLPGSVGQRPCLQKLFAAAFPSTPTVVYEKTFVQPNEDALNLYLDALNNLWIEDVGVSLGTASIFQNLPEPPGAIKTVVSCTQFGREYIAASDGFHGAHVPLQFDGTYLDRVTQDGPGTAPIAFDEVSTFTIAASGVPGISCVNPTENISSSTVSGDIGTAVLAALPWDVEPGDFVTLTLIAGGNVGFFILAVSGNAIQLQGPIDFSEFTGVVTFYGYQITTTTPNIFAVGQQATIGGVTVTQYDNTLRVCLVTSTTVFTVALNQDTNTSLANSGGGTVAVAGSSSTGTHQVVVMFLTRQGYITKCSPVFAWDSAGGVRTVFSNIPLGPSNVVARILGLTGAGGDNFFYIPTTVNVPGAFGSPAYTVYSTVINDNSTTAATIDFNDNSLFSATAIDIPGRNYFAQVVLSDCTTVFPYASRLFWGGERNKIQNLLNTGFEGGYQSGVLTVPAGWNLVGSAGGGTLVTGGAWAAGQAWQITNTTTNTPSGVISQSAYQDSLGVPIFLPNTLYQMRLWVKTSASAYVIATLTSASTSFSIQARAHLPLVDFAGGFIAFNFAAVTPAAIPPDFTLTIWTENTAALAGGTVLLDEIQFIPVLNPYRDNVWRVSYANAPEQMDGVTGVLGSTNDPSQIRCGFQLRNTMYFHTANGLHSTTDNGFGEPSSWNVPEVSQAVGAVSFKASDPGRTGTGESGEQWQFTISEGGLYVFAGGEMLKVSQEIQQATKNGMPGWNSINQAAIQTAWVKNDRVSRRCYLGVPVGTATAPNVIFVLDYRELNDAYAISNSPPVHISFTGKMIASDLCRKWTRWNLASNCGEILARSSSSEFLDLTFPGFPGSYQFCLGAGNGETIGSAPGFGNVYQLNEEYLTDDDYGQVTPYYTTYFFVSREQEQMLQLDCHRKLASYLGMFISGTGETSITPLGDTLLNSWPALPAYPLSATQNHDYEWGMNVTAERIALKIGSVPVEGTDNGFQLSHLAMTMKKEPIAFLRGAM